MKIPHGRELGTRMLVALFVLAVCAGAGVLFLTGTGSRPGLVGVVVFLLALFLIGLGVSVRSPGNKIERN